MSGWGARLSLPHPVLSSDRRDYRDECSFEGEVVSAGRKDGVAAALVEYRLRSDAIEALIGRGDAQYCALAACVGSKTREAFMSFEARRRVELPLARYPGEARVEFFVVACRDVRVSSADLADDLAFALPDGFSAPAGAPLAVGGAGIVNPDKTNDVQSFIEFVNNPVVERGEFEIDLSSDRIVIEINPADRMDVNRIRNESARRDPFWASVFAAAIEKGIRLHLDDDYAGMAWAANMRRLLAEREIEIDADALERKALSYAHRLLGRPFGKMLAAGGETEEDED